MLLRKSALTFLIQAGSVTCTGLVFVLMTRIDGSDGQGRFAVVYTLLTLATTAAGAGVGLGAVYHLASSARPRQVIISTTVGAALGSALLAIAAVASVGAAGGGSLLRGIGPLDLGLALAITPLLVASNALAMLMLGFNRPLAYSSLPFAQMLVTLVGQGILAIDGRLDPDSGLGAWLAGAAASSALGIWLLRKELRSGLRVHLPLLRDLVAYGLPGYAGNVAMLFVYRLDIILINAFLDLTQVGYYVAAVAVSEAAWYVASSVALVLFPHVAGMARAEATHETLVVIRSTLLVSAVGVSVLYLVGGRIVALLFGPGMTPSSPALWILLPGVLALAPAKIVSSYMNGIGKPRRPAMAAISALPVTLVLDLFLIPRMGISGAALASSATYLVIAVTSMILFGKESGASWRDSLVPKPADFAAAWRALATAWRTPGWARS